MRKRRSTSSSARSSKSSTASVTTPAGRAEYHYVIIDYACRVRSGTPTAAARGTDAADVRWVPIAELDRYRMTPAALAVIEKARA